MGADSGGRACGGAAVVTNAASATAAFTSAAHERWASLMVASVSALTSLRKYGVSLTLAHQYLHQLEPEVRHAVLGNAGTLISFRVGPEDANVMASQFQPTFQTVDLMNLPNRDFYLKLMIDGAPSKPFSARTLDQ